MKRTIICALAVGMLAGCLWSEFGEVRSQAQELLTNATAREVTHQTADGGVTETPQPQLHEGHCAPEKIYRCSHSPRCCYDCMYSCP